MSIHGVSRRTTLKFAGLIVLAARSPRAASRLMMSSSLHGYGSDPNLLERPVTWPRTLDPSQLATLQSLAGIILPAELSHPSAAETNVQDFLDEWLSAPYPQMQADRQLILAGLTSLDADVRGQWNRPFVDAQLSQQVEVFSRACGNAATVRFASRIIELVCSGYYTTRVGHAAIGYAGNVGMKEFPGPPAEVVRHLETAASQLLGK